MQIKQNEIDFGVKLKFINFPLGTLEGDLFTAMHNMVGERSIACFAIAGSDDRTSNKITITSTSLSMYLDDTIQAAFDKDGSYVLPYSVAIIFISR